jgi:hypothetical protein
MRLVLVLRRLPPDIEGGSGDEVGGDVKEGDEEVGEVVVEVVGFFLNISVRLFQKPPFIVLFFLCRIYIII